MKQDGAISINRGDAVALIEALTNSAKGPLYLQETTQVLANAQPEVAKIESAGTAVSEQEGQRHEIGAILQAVIQHHQKNDPEFSKRADGRKMDDISNTLLNDIARNGLKVTSAQETPPVFAEHLANGSFPTQSQDYGYKYVGLTREKMLDAKMPPLQLMQQQGASILTKEKFEGLKGIGHKIQNKI